LRVSRCRAFCPRVNCSSCVRRLVKACSGRAEAQQLLFGLSSALRIRSTIWPAPSRVPERRLRAGLLTRKGLARKFENMSEPARSATGQLRESPPRRLDLGQACPAGARTTSRSAVRPAPPGPTRPRAPASINAALRAELEPGKELMRIIGHPATGQLLGSSAELTPKRAAPCPRLRLPRSASPRYTQLAGRRQ
jgi:hypothetical protein